MKERKKVSYWWEVEHPDHGTALVPAADVEGALVAAAAGWGAKWTELRFCGYAHVRQMTGGSATYP